MVALLQKIDCCWVYATAWVATGTERLEASFAFVIQNGFGEDTPG